MVDTIPPPENQTELSVSDLSRQLKRAIETTFDFVRVRGELGRVTVARSGHMYADLKDDNAVLSTVMWKGNVSRLPFRPEEGLEVVAEGKLSTYPGRSTYQLIADTMKPAGAGALMALLEERKKKLAAEGLFAQERKKPLPMLPSRIGVVTSPTGAVIRDILHRIGDRFPVHVIIWPALVQGDLAAAQIEAGIRGFNALQGPDRPDLIIVARGGGSIEDLWPFNEEAVVRAAADSVIPLISAVGHETDTTLIDYVADARAPTPTGAAEIAVPVRAELAVRLDGAKTRLTRGLMQRIAMGLSDLRALAARLPRTDTLIGARAQRLDVLETRLARALERRIARARNTLQAHATRLPNPKQYVTGRRQALMHAGSMLDRAWNVDLRRHTTRFDQAARRLQPEPVRRVRAAAADRVRIASDRLGRAGQSHVQALRVKVSSVSKLLDSLSHQSVLKRGFALVRTSDGALVRDTATAANTAADGLSLTFADGTVSIGGERQPDAPRPDTAKAKPKPKSQPAPADDQGQLF